MNVPRHVYLERDCPTGGTVEEHDEYIVINGVRINKPCVEKPVDADDHNVIIFLLLNHTTLTKAISW